VYKFILKRLTFLLAMTSLLTACGGGSDDTPPPPPPPSAPSYDTTYTNVQVLGSNVNHATAFDAGPEISSNYLELYFYSDRPGGAGGMDMYVSTRADIADPWGPATNLAILNSTVDDRQPNISSDGLTLIFTSSRVGGHGGLDLYMSTRASLGDPWGAPTNMGNILNTASGEAGPSISDDGLSLYFHSDRASGLGSADLYVSTRAATVDAWGTPINLGATVNSTTFDVAPVIASDGLTLYFHTLRPGGVGAHDIWKTTRASVADPWGTPVALPTPVNSIEPETGPGLSDDWQTLYFASDVGGNRDIWEATP